MCVNNLPKVATRWNSGATRDSNRGHWARFPTIELLIGDFEILNQGTEKSAPELIRTNNIETKVS